MKAQLDFFQGTGLDGAKVILNRCMYTYIYTICVQLHGRIFLHHMASLRNSWKSCPPDLPLTAPLTWKCTHLWAPQLPNPSCSTVPSLFWSCAASGYEEDLTWARTWWNFCTNFQLNLYLAKYDTCLKATFWSQKSQNGLGWEGLSRLCLSNLSCHG